MSQSTLTILGSTGSIGQSTLDVVARHPEQFRIHALTAARNVARMLDDCRRFEPAVCVMTDEAAAAELARELRAAGLSTEVQAGAEALCRVADASEVDSVMAAIVGAPGLAPTLAAAKAGKRILLANKEALVMSGALFMRAVREAGAVLLPVDSEHNAVFQGMPDGYVCGKRAAGVTRVVLTASGGPFRERAIETLTEVTPDEACAHPNWEMGRKISVDSATMMNKGLEVIEACWLFDVPSAEVDVVLHPQSVVHSLVEYADGSLLAQLGQPDMRTPIAHCLAWPGRIASGVPRLDMQTVGRLEFMAPDLRRFPCLRFARDALDAGGTASTVLNAANEVAVAAFLEGRAGFMQIPELIAHALETVPAVEMHSMDDVLTADAAARAAVQARLRGQ